MLSTFIRPDDVRWPAVLERARHDVYHLPEYLTLCAKSENSEPLAFYAEEGGAACLIPLLRKQIPESFDAPQTWCDLASPYGYPGPLYTHALDEELIAAFLTAFRCAADELGACSVFLRLHPLFESAVGVQIPFSAYVRHGETVSIDLTRSEEEMWRQTRHDYRRGIRKLEELKFTAAMDDWSQQPAFARMYRETMVRLGADPYYLFSDEYFSDLRSSLGEKLHLCTVVAPEGRCAAAGLYTTVDGIVEGHLAGSDPIYSQFAPTKLMQHFVRLWGKKQGSRVFHLGGGVGGRKDSLYSFKARFSPDRNEFWTLRIIPNERRYAALNDCPGHSLNPLDDLEADYFPPHRQHQVQSTCPSARHSNAAAANSV